MTVAYMQFTHTSAKIGVFFRVLRIWKGGVFKVNLQIFAETYFLV